MRLYCPDLPDSGTVELHAEEFNYAKNVLRARHGNEILLFDAKGKEAVGVITRLDRGRLCIQINEVSRNNKTQKESALGIRLLQGIPKGPKMDFIVQKATELGVSEIQPLVTGRTQVDIRLKETRKPERWQKIAVEAARQCGRPVAPVIKEPVSFVDFFNLDEGMNRGAGIIFWEKGGPGLKELAEFFLNFLSGAGGTLEGAEVKHKNRKISLAVGPEGGFLEEEAALAVEKGFYLAGLGPRILRAETAAIMAVGLAQFLFGDMG